MDRGSSELLRCGTLRGAWAEKFRAAEESSGTAWRSCPPSWKPFGVPCSPAWQVQLLRLPSLLVQPRGSAGGALVPPAPLSQGSSPTSTPSGISPVGTSPAPAPHAPGAWPSSRGPLELQASGPELQLRECAGQTGFTFPAEAAEEGGLIRDVEEDEDSLRHPAGETWADCDLEQTAPGSPLPAQQGSEHNKPSQSTLPASSSCWRRAHSPGPPSAILLLSANKPGFSSHLGPEPVLQMLDLLLSPRVAAYSTEACCPKTLAADANLGLTSAHASDNLPGAEASALAAPYPLCSQGFESRVSSQATGSCEATPIADWLLRKGFPLERRLRSCSGHQEAPPTASSPWQHPQKQRACSSRHSACSLPLCLPSLA